MTLTDGLNCTIVDSISIVAPTPVLATVIDTTSVDCYGANTGSVTIAGSGGTAPYLYSVDGGVTFVGSPVFNNLSAQTSPGYVLVVQDANGCLDSVNQVLSQPNQLQGIIVAPTTMVSCFGFSDGVITVTGLGGIPPYEYSFLGAPFDTTSTFTGLSVGTYSVEVRDSNQCLFTISNIQITQPNILLLNIDSISNVLCNGDCNGLIEVSANQGTPGYEYSIDGISYQNSGLFTNLCAGTYTLYVRDAQGCVTSRVITLDDPDVLVANVAATSFYPPLPTYPNL